MLETTYRRTPLPPPDKKTLRLVLKKEGSKMSKKRIKKRVEKVDGLSAHDIKKIRAAIRQVWHRSHVRKLCVSRCIGKDGFSYCELCKKRAPKIFIDHKEKVGAVDGGFIRRLFTPSKNLQGLCKKCHDAKTKAERAEERRREKEKEAEKDFY